MFNIEKLIELEENLPLDSEMIKFQIEGEKQLSTKIVYNNILKYIKRKGLVLNNNLNDVLPIIYYQSLYKDDFYSRIVNVHCDDSEIEIRNYFKYWLEKSLIKLPTFNKMVYHHIKDKDLPALNRFILIRNFRDFNGKV